MSAADIKAVKDHIIEEEKLKAQLRNDPDFAARFREEFLAQLSKKKAEQEKNAEDIHAFVLHMTNLPASDLRDLYQQDRYPEYHTTPKEEPKKPTHSASATLEEEPKKHTSRLVTYPELEMDEDFTV